MEIGKNYFVIDFNYAASSFNKCIFYPVGICASGNTI